MEDLPESLAGAEGLVDAEQGRSGNHNTHCLNCGTPLKGVYCHVCGQKDLPRRQTMGELWENLISSVFNYEGKFLRTIRSLVTRPGQLAIEYNEGKRERFFHPIRMYAFISFVFFLLFFNLPDKPDKPELTEEDKEELARNEQEVKQSLAASGLDTAFLNTIDTVNHQKDSVVRKSGMKYSLSKTEYKTMGAYDSAQALLPDSVRDNWITRKFVKRSIELNQRYGDDNRKFGQEFLSAIKENFSKMLFILLPVFALVLKLLYVRKNYFYSEHLVFSIYYYNFFYFAASIILLIGLVPALDWLGTLIGYGIYVYLLAAMKRMYGQSWGRTIAKFLAFSFLFMIAFVIGFSINIMVIIMFI